jgi:hypothetical protein
LDNSRGPLGAFSHSDVPKPDKNIVESFEKKTKPDLSRSHSDGETVKTDLNAQHVGIPWDHKVHTAQDHVWRGSARL